MHRKPASGFPANSCSIRMPDATSPGDALSEEPDGEQQRRRQQLINFAHSHWGFKNWSWAVTKQDLDFVDYSNGKYCVGVVAFVSVTVKSMDIHREDIGYATTQAPTKGSAIFQARKCAVTNALKETLLSFGGTFATSLMELIEALKTDLIKLPPPELQQENNQNVINKVDVAEPKNSSARNVRKDSSDSNASRETKSPHKTAPLAQNKPAQVPVAKTQPMPANQVPVVSKPVFPPANQIPPKPQAQQATGAPLTHMRPNSNVSFVLQPMMPGVLPSVYQSPSVAPRMPIPHQHLFPNYYEYAPSPWHFAYDGYDRHHGNVNLNFNIPPKNLVVNSRAGTVECKNSCSPGKGSAEETGIQHAPHPSQHPYHHSGNGAACWIKPTIFYDGFWTEQKVKKWVAEQVEKQFPEEAPPPAASASPLLHPHSTSAGLSSASSAPAHPPSSYNEHTKQ